MNKTHVIEFFGSREKAILTLCKMGIENKQDAESILDFLRKNSYLLDETESVEFNCNAYEDNMMSLTLFETSLYINVKALTIVMAAFLLDITLTSGIAALSTSLLGINSQAFSLIPEDGEKCVLRETLACKPRIGDVNILNAYEGKCQNPNYKCKYRSGDFCNCTHDIIKSIYENLTEKNIFKRTDDRNHYIYQW